MDFETTNFDLSRSSSGFFCDGMRFGLVYTYCTVLYSTCTLSRTRYVREKPEDDLSGRNLLLQSPFTIIIIIIIRVHNNKNERLLCSVTYTMFKYYVG